jgi:ankyrin repeat protein
MKLKSFLACLLFLGAAIAFSAARAGSYEDFFTAIQRDNGAVVTELLNRGFDPDSVDGSGQPALIVAVKLQSMRAVQALLQHPGLNMEAANAAGETALMLAALKGDLATSRLLLDRGAKVDRAGWSPIHYAATGPEPKVVALLLDRGAPVNAASPNGSTPLMMAARYGAAESAPLLLDRGADPKRKNALGLQAGDFARLGGREALALKLDALQR